MRLSHGVLLGLTASFVASIGALAQTAVLCTTTIVGDVVRAVAGPESAVDVLFPIGADPHSFEASPRDVALVESADLVFLSGRGLETTLASMLEVSLGRVVDLSEDLPLRHAAGDGIESGDPHVWLNPLYVAAWADKIATALSEIDPGNALAYGNRAAAYRVRMEDLDHWIRDRVAIIPREARCLVSDHQSLGYFAEAYDFVEVGTVIPGYSTQAEPSAREIAFLEDAIRVAGVRCIFVETALLPGMESALPSKLAEQIADDTQAEIRFLYIGSLSGADGPASTYDALMRFDVDQIVQGLTTP